jgi:hypothetical protein
LDRDAKGISRTEKLENLALLHRSKTFKKFQETSASPEELAFGQELGLTIDEIFAAKRNGKKLEEVANEKRSV